MLRVHNESPAEPIGAAPTVCAIGSSSPLDRWPVVRFRLCNQPETLPSALWVPPDLLSQPRVQDFAMPMIITGTTLIIGITTRDRQSPQVLPLLRPTTRYREKATTPPRITVSSAMMVSCRRLPQRCPLAGAHGRLHFGRPPRQ